jgi:hypothetical protein
VAKIEAFLLPRLLPPRVYAGSGMHPLVATWGCTRMSARWWCNGSQTSPSPSSCSGPPLQCNAVSRGSVGSVCPIPMQEHQKFKTTALILLQKQGILLLCSALRSAAMHCDRVPAPLRHLQVQVSATLAGALSFRPQLHTALRTCVATLPTSPVG